MKLGTKKNLLALGTFCVALMFGIGSVQANPYKPNEKEVAQAKVKVELNCGAKVSLKATAKSNVFEVIKAGKTIGNLYFRILAPHGEDFTYFALLGVKREILSFGILTYDCSTGDEVTKPSWSKRLLGKKAKNLQIGKDVDAVSGGTMSVEAILSDLESL